MLAVTVTVVVVATASTTLDSGIEVVGVYSIMKDDKSGGDTDVLGVSTNQNDVSLSGGFGTFTIGNLEPSILDVLHYSVDDLIHLDPLLNMLLIELLLRLSLFLKILQVIKI